MGLETESRGGEETRRCRWWPAPCQGWASSGQPRRGAVRMGLLPEAGVRGCGCRRGDARGRAEGFTPRWVRRKREQTVIKEGWCNPKFLLTFRPARVEGADPGGGAVPAAAASGCCSYHLRMHGLLEPPTNRAWRCTRPDCMEGKGFWGGSVPSSVTRCKTVLGRGEGVVCHWEQNHPASPAEALPRPGLGHLRN